MLVLRFLKTGKKMHLSLIGSFAKTGFTSGGELEREKVAHSTLRPIENITSLSSAL